MSDLIRREDVMLRVREFIGNKSYDELMLVNDLNALPSAEPERKWTVHEVACLLAELFGDDCACNYNGIDEWLPEKCELQDACPNPVGVACWEQFLKWRGDR